MAASSKTHHIQVPPGTPPERLDRYLAKFEFIGSRTRASELIQRGLVTVRGKPLKSSFQIQGGLSLDVELPEPTPTHLVPLNRPLDILFEDSELLVINKPSGLVVHPGAGHSGDTLVNVLLYHVDNLAIGFDEKRPGIVHRLDMDTSGLLVVAKTDFSHRNLAEQFRLKTTHRIYWAVAWGTPTPAHGTMRSHLSRHPKNRKKFASTSTESVGKLAITHYKVLKTHPSGISWLQCKLETGRTHQIRVHLSERGHPILGDPIYGHNRNKTIISRLALHACELGFVHPVTHESMLFRASWPDDLRAKMKQWGFE